MDRVEEKIIIGSGFSGYILCKLHPDYHHYSFNSNLKTKRKHLFRRKNLDINKFFSEKVYSIGSIVYKNITLHDRLSDGGNSNIWGGFFVKNNDHYKLLSDAKLSSIKHSYDTNISKLYKLENKVKTKTFNSKGIINHENEYLQKISIVENKIKLDFLDKVIYVDELILCIGVVQLIDLLYRSGYIETDTIIELDEFQMKYKLTKDLKSNYIRYKFSKIIEHFFNIQIKSKFVNMLLNRFPISIYQIFENQKNSVCGVLKDNKINFLNKKFGKSIHYNNLRINKTPIRIFLKNINVNIKGYGMAFVNQKIPGPISNEILDDILDNEIK